MEDWSPGNLEHKLPGRHDGQKDRQIDRPTDGLIDRQMERWTHTQGQIGRQLNKCQDISFRDKIMYITQKQIAAYIDRHSQKKFSAKIDRRIEQNNRVPKRRKIQTNVRAVKTNCQKMRQQRICGFTIYIQCYIECTVQKTESYSETQYRQTIDRQINTRVGQIDK